MGGRGTFAAGNPVPYTFKTVGYVDGIKVLEGITTAHGLPEEAHSSKAYAQLNKDGTLRTLRFYDKQHRLRLEIANHPERKLAVRYGLPISKPILHFHLYDITGTTKWHGDAQLATNAMRKRYGKLFGKDLR